MKNIRVFLSEKFRVLEVKLSVYLNRCVFVMTSSEEVGAGDLASRLITCSRC